MYISVYNCISLYCEFVGKARAEEEKEGETKETPRERTEVQHEAGKELE